MQEATASFGEHRDVRESHSRTEQLPVTQVDNKRYVVFNAMNQDLTRKGTKSCSPHHHSNLTTSTNDFMYGQQIVQLDVPFVHILPPSVIPL